MHLQYSWEIINKAGCPVSCQGPCVDSSKTAHIDLELEEYNAFKELYPEAEIDGCDFNWK